MSSQPITRSNTLFVRPESGLSAPQSGASTDSVDTLVNSDNATGPLKESKVGADLWQEAIAKVKPKLPDDVKPESKDRASTLQVILEEAISRRDETQKSQRKLHRNSGRDVTYRELYGNIITWVQKFQIIGDIAIQADAGYASLPWALVRVFIISAVGEHETYGSMLEGIELVSNLIYHYAVIEQIYSGKETKLVAGLRKSLVSLYVAILIYLVQALEYFGSSKARRFFKGLSPTANAEIKKLLSAIVEAKNDVDTDSIHVNDEIARQGLDYLAEGQRRLEEQIARAGVDQELQTRCVTEMIQEWKTPLATMTDKISDVYDMMEEDQMVKILNWLSKVQHESLHIAVQNGRLESSGKWLINSSLFRRWLTSSESSILWMHGILGSGKTNLVSIVIDHLRAIRTKQEGQQILPARLAFFYCSSNRAPSENPKDEASRTEPVEVFRSIIRQLSMVERRLDLDFAVKEKYRQLKNNEVGEPRKLTMPECVELLKVLSRDAPTTIVIDALDELKPTTRVGLIKGLEDVVNSCPEQTKVFLSTRHIPSIIRHLEPHPSLEVTADKNGNDISSFIATQLEKKIHSGEFLDGEASEELRIEVQKALTERAGGMFWYASLQLNLLCDPEQMWDEDTVRESLLVLPASLRDLYEKILDDIDSDDYVRNRVTAQNTLKWLLCAQVPLKCSSFLEAVSSKIGGKAFKPTRGFITNACKTLVVINHESDVFEFAHLSVREYLDKRRGYELGECHLTAARSCLRAVDDSFGSSMINRTMSEPEKSFGCYASLYWPVHYQNIDLNSAHERVEETRDSLKDLLIQGQDTTPAFKQWLAQVQGLALDFPMNDPLSLKIGSLQSTPQTSLFTACVFGFPDVIEQFGRDRRFNFDQCNNQNQTALCLAVENNQLETVKALLSRSRVDVNTLNIWAIVQFQDLRRLGKPQKKEASSSADTRITIPGQNRTTGSDWKDIETLPPVICFASALQAGALKGHERMAEYLLEQRANVNLVAGFYGSPLQAAALGGHESLVRCFLERYQAEPNSQGGFFGNALQAAAIHGSVPILSLLLEHGAVVSTPGGHYGSALMAATSGGHLDGVKIILNAGAYIDVYSEDYGTPLQRAADLDNEELLQLFIKKGADINAHKSLDQIGPGIENGSALATAAFGGHKKMVSLLLRNGAETELRYQGSGLHILHQAATLGMIDLVEYCLKSKECNIDVPLVTTLRKYGDRQILTPLAYACVEGHVDVVRLLLDRGAAIEYPGDSMTVLHQAARRGHASIVTLLVEAQVSRVGAVKAQTYIDRRLPHSDDTALHEAARAGSVDAITTLFDHNASYTTNSQDVTPLQAAAFRNKPYAVQTFLDKKKQQGVNGVISIESRNTLGRTALIDAARENHLTVVIVLLEHGLRECDESPGRFRAFVNQRDLKGQTALSHAAEQGNDAITDQLLTGYQADYTLRKVNLCTPLHLAVAPGHIGSTVLLLNHVSTDVDVHKFQSFLNATNVYNNTALMDAVNSDRASLIDLLLNKYGADFSIPDGKRCTVLHVAACRGRIPVLEIIVDYVAKHTDETRFASFVNARNRFDKTALHDACERDRTQVVEILLRKCKADYTLVDDEGSTALHWGVRNQCNVVFRLLDIASGDAENSGDRFRTFLSRKDKRSQTALDLAKKQGWHYFVDVLKNQYGVI